MTEFFTASDGARLAFSDTGTGTPVLCLPGLTRTMADFDYLLPHLPPGLRIIRMDYRGRGQSQWTGAETYTVPTEARDALELLDHLGVARTAVLGTSRGGLIALALAVAARDRLTGVAFNDIGPVIERNGLERIFHYLGRNPTPKTHETLAEALPRVMPGFANVPAERWLAEARKHYVQTEGGLRITYDPTLREAFIAAFSGPAFDAWPLFDALQGAPVALIRGANSDLLSKATADEMQSRRPDMIFADIPDRAHIPFLDEPGSLAALNRWLEALP